MHKVVRVTVTTVAVGMAALSLSAPAQAGGSAVGAGLAGFGIGVILGSVLPPPEVYVVPPPPPYYYGPVVYGPPPYDYYGPDVSVPPQAIPHAYSYRAPAHTPRDASTHRQRSGATRSTTVKTGTGAVERESEAKFKAAQAKAEKLGGVQNLTKQDIDGLSSEQLKQLRGY
jgi:hypothetical protein